MKPPKRVVLVAIVFALSSPAMACVVNIGDTVFQNGFDHCPRDQSTFVRLAADKLVDSIVAVPIITKTITLSQPSRILVVADGRYFPVDAPAGSVRIAVNGSEANTTYSVVDWGSSSKPVQHSFNVLAYAELLPGQHAVALVASSRPNRQGRFTVGSGSGLSILVEPMSTITVSSLQGESSNVNVTTYSPGQGIDTIEGGASRPSTTILSHDVTNGNVLDSKIVSLISGRAIHSCNSGINGGRGDTLWGIWSDGSCQSTSSAAWSVNDIDPGAEMEAPMYTHSLHSLSADQTKSISFRASELAFGSDQADSPAGAHENGVCYKVAGAKLLFAVSSSVIGGATGGSESFCSTYTWQCIATTQGHPGCPQAGTEVKLGTALISIPEWHDGIVFFSAKTRIQGDNSDSFSTVTLSIKVDGVSVGAIGVQQLANGVGQASRTLTASYLSASGANSARLQPGKHTIDVYVSMQADQVKHASVPRDLVLTYFD